MTLPHSARYVVPVLRPWPIWRYGQLHRGWGWYPDWYALREVSRAEAEVIHAEQAAKNEDAARRERAACC